MAQARNTVETFLEPQQLALVNRYREDARQLEFPTQTPLDLEGHLEAHHEAMMSSLMSFTNDPMLKHIMTRTGKEALSGETVLRAAFTGHAILQSMLDTTTQWLAVGTAQEIQQGNEAARADARRILTRLNQGRAILGMRILLFNCGHVWTESTQFKTETPWNKSHLVYERMSMLRPPFHLTPAASDRLGSLIQRASQQPRAAVGVPAELLDLGPSPEQTVRDYVEEAPDFEPDEGHMQVIEEFTDTILPAQEARYTPEEMTFALTTSKGMRAYMERAGKMDGSILSDVRFRFLDLMLETAYIPDEDSTQAVLERDIDRFLRYGATEPGR